MSRGLDGDLPRITIRRWDDSVVDDYGLAANGDYSRTLWLPIIGPTSWLLWGSLAARLPEDGSALACDVRELAEELGVAPMVSKNARLPRSVVRLTTAKLLHGRDGEYRVRLCAPLVTARQLAKLPDHIATRGVEFHRGLIRDGWGPVLFT